MWNLWLRSQIDSTVATYPISWNYFPPQIRVHLTEPFMGKIKETSQVYLFQAPRLQQTCLTCLSPGTSALVALLSPALDFIFSLSLPLSLSFSFSYSLFLSLSVYVSTHKYFLYCILSGSDSLSIIVVKKLRKNKLQNHSHTDS